MFVHQFIDTLPNIINYALRFPAELRKNETVDNGFFDNWATNLKIGGNFGDGPRKKEDNDGGEPPGYIPVTYYTTNHRKSLRNQDQTFFL